MRTLLLIIGLLSSTHFSAQPNCKAYLYKGDTAKYKACIMSEKIASHYQFSKEFQMILDSALAIDSTYAYAYREKSVAYLKSGNFLEWKALIDQAVRHDSVGNLGYRAWCRYQFFSDYTGSIQDIEILERKGWAQWAYGANGNYHLLFTKALCLKALMRYPQAMQIMDSLLNSPDYTAGIYDHYHHGVLAYQMNDFTKAQNALEKQIERNPIADAYYYLSKLALEQKHLDISSENYKKAKELYAEDLRAFDPYTQIQDAITEAELY